MSSMLHSWSTYLLSHQDEHLSKVNWIGRHLFMTSSRNLTRIALVQQEVESPPYWHFLMPWHRSTLQEWCRCKWMPHGQPMLFDFMPWSSRANVPQWPTMRQKRQYGMLRNSNFLLSFLSHPWSPWYAKRWVLWSHLLVSWMLGWTRRK